MALAPIMPGARNVSGELEAAYRACQFAYEHGADRITLYTDYEGVKFFATHDWNARNLISITYVQLMDKISIPIRFEIIKGHSGNTYNDLVDKLAKNANV